MSNPALIIVDMQKGMALPAAGERNNPEAEARVRDLLLHWRKARAPIVHVRHISRDPRSVFWPGQTGAEFQEALSPLDREAVFEKNVPDAFLHSGLERWFRVRDIDSLVIVGVSTNHSVESTARSAGNLGFATHVVSDACFAFAKADFRGIRHDAEVVHAMSLANLQGEYASILDSVNSMRLVKRPECFEGSSET